MKRLFRGALAAALSLALLAGCGGTPAAQQPAAEQKQPAQQAQQPAAGGSQQAAAQGPKITEGPKIKEIRQRGKLIVGVKYDVPLFGYLDPKDQQVKGFEVDLSRLIAKAILGDENKVELKQVKSADRIPALQQGDVDLVIATMTINEERKKVIDFSQPYYLAGMGLMAKKGSNINKVEDLAGKTVAAVKGANSGPNLERIAKEKNIQVTIDLYPTYPEAVSAVKAGRAAAMVTDNVIIAGYVEQDPELYLVPGRLTDEPYGVGVKKGNDDLLKAVNEIIASAIQSGELKKLADKWKVPYELK